MSRDFFFNLPLLSTLVSNSNWNCVLKSLGLLRLLSEVTHEEKFWIFSHKIISKLKTMNWMYWVSTDHFCIKLKVRACLSDEHDLSSGLPQSIPCFGKEMGRMKVTSVAKSTQLIIAAACTHHSWGCKYFIHDLMFLVRNLQLLLFF